MGGKGELHKAFSFRKWQLFLARIPSIRAR